MGKNNMTFYQAMQLGAERLKPMIKNEEDKKTKQKYLGAFILKNILCILFCMLVVVFFSSFFGSENSMVGVVTILLVLTFRFTNLDFKIDQSAFTLLGVFMIYAICPYLASNSNHFVGFVINFVSILSIIIFTCNNMMYANHTVLILSYFLLYGNPVTSIQSFYLRFMGLLLGGVIVALIFYIKNKKLKIEFNNTILDVLKSFDISHEKGAWQLKLALGISSVVFIGEMLNFKRTMWLAFACMTVLSQSSEEKLNHRCKIRISSILIGAILFGTAYILLPKNMVGVFPILAGLLAGFCASYENKTIIYNFSALPAAIETIGFVDTLVFRVVNNVFGALYSKGFDVVYTKIMDKINNKNDDDNFGSLNASM